MYDYTNCMQRFKYFAHIYITYKETIYINMIEIILYE